MGRKSSAKVHWKGRQDTGLFFREPFENTQSSSSLVAACEVMMSSCIVAWRAGECTRWSDPMGRRSIFFGL